MANSNLRTVLDRHGYTSHYSEDSTELVEILLNDLLKTLCALKTVGKKYEEATNRITELTETLAKKESDALANLKGISKSKYAALEKQCGLNAKRAFRLSRMLGSLFFILRQMFSPEESSKQAKSSKSSGAAGWSSASISLLSLLLSYEESIEDKKGNTSSSTPSFPAFIKEFHTLWKVSEERDMLAQELKNHQHQLDEGCCSNSADTMDTQNLEKAIDQLKRRVDDWLGNGCGVNENGKILDLVTQLKSDYAALELKHKSLQRRVVELLRGSSRKRCRSTPRSHKRMGHNHKRSLSQPQQRHGWEEPDLNETVSDDSYTEVDNNPECFRHIEELNTLIHRMNNLQHQNEELMVQCQQMKSNVEVAEARISFLTTQTASQTETLNSRQETLKTCQAELKQLESTVQELQQSLSEHEACKCVLEKGLIAVAKKLEDQTKAKDECIVEKEKVRKQYDDLVAQQGATNQRIASLTADIQSCEKNRQLAVEKLSQTTNELERAIRSIESMSSEIQNLQNHQQQSLEETTKLKKALKDAISEKEKLRIYARSLIKERDWSSRELEASRATVNSLKDVIADLEERIKVLVDGCTALKQSGSEIPGTDDFKMTAKTKDSTDYLVQEIRILTSLRDESVREKELAFQKCKKLEMSRKSLQVQLDAAEERHKMVSQQLSLYSDRCESLERLVAKQRQNICEMEMSFKQLLQGSRRDDSSFSATRSYRTSSWRTPVSLLDSSTLLSGRQLFSNTGVSFSASTNTMNLPPEAAASTVTPSDSTISRLNGAAADEPTPIPHLRDANSIPIDNVVPPVTLVELSPRVETTTKTDATGTELHKRSPTTDECAPFDDEDLQWIYSPSDKHLDLLSSPNDELQCRSVVSLDKANGFGQPETSESSACYTMESCSSNRAVASSDIGSKSNVSMLSCMKSVATNDVPSSGSASVSFYRGYDSSKQPVSSSIAQDKLSVTIPSVVDSLYLSEESSAHNRDSVGPVSSSCLLTPGMSCFENTAGAAGVSVGNASSSCVLQFSGSSSQFSHVVSRMTRTSALSAVADDEEEYDEDFA